MAQESTVSRESSPSPTVNTWGSPPTTRRIPTLSFPPIEPLRPPEGRTERARRPDRRLWVRRLERVRRPDQHADRRAAGDDRPEVQPLPHDGALLADAPGAAHRAQPPLGQHGRHLRDRDVGARLQLGAAEGQGAARHDPQAQWLLDRAVRQVPRGAGLGDEPDGAVQPVADRGRRVRAFLRLHRRRDQPVVPGHLRRHHRRSSRPRPRRRATTSPRT